MFRQKIHQIDKLHLTIDRCVQEKYDEKRFGTNGGTTPDLEMEVVKFEYENSPGFITSPNTTNSSFKSDLAGFVEGTK